MTEIFDGLTFINDPITEEDRVVHLLACLPESQNKEIVPEGYLGSVPLMFVSSRMSPRASWPPSSWPVDFSMTIGRN